jgi:hypothetical protein
MQKRVWSHRLLRDDAEDIQRILAKRSKSDDDIKTLANIFEHYAYHSSDSYRSLPVDLVRFVADEVKKFADDRTYKPFPVKTGAPRKLDWDTVDSAVRLVFEFGNLDNPGAELDLRKIFKGIIKQYEVDPYEQLDPNTLGKHIALFREENPHLFPSEE